MTMIGVGRRQLDIANRGMAAVTRADSVEEQQRLALEAQKTAGENSTMGLGAGIGGQIGATKVAEAGKTATDAIKAANDSVKGLGEIGKSGGKLTFTPATVGAETVTGEAATTLIDSAAGIADAGTTATTLAETTALAETAALAEGTVAAGTVAAEAGATTLAADAVVAAELAAGSTGTAATLGAIAAPVAIGLGVAFLLNKLFD
jgi:hypothetical protein